jgi:hypothetical protein
MFALFGTPFHLVNTLQRSPKDEDVTGPVGRMHARMEGNRRRESSNGVIGNRIMESASSGRPPAPTHFFLSSTDLQTALAHATLAHSTHA